MLAESKVAVLSKQNGIVVCSVTWPCRNFNFSSNEVSNICFFELHTFVLHTFYRAIGSSDLGTFSFPGHRRGSFHDVGHRRYGLHCGSGCLQLDGIGKVVLERVRGTGDFPRGDLGLLRSMSAPFHVQERT